MYRQCLPRANDRASGVADSHQDGGHPSHVDASLSRKPELGIDAISKGQPSQRELVVTGFRLQIGNDLEIGGDLLGESFAARDGKSGVRRSDRTLQITELTPSRGELA